MRLRLKQHLRGIVPLTHAHLQLHVLPRKALDHRRHLLRVPHARQPPQLGGHVDTRALRRRPLRLAPCARLPEGGLGQQDLTGREDIIRHRGLRHARPFRPASPTSRLPRRRRLLLELLLCRRRRRRWLLLRCALRRQLLQSDACLQLACQITLGQRQGQRQVRVPHICRRQPRRDAHTAQLGDTPGHVVPNTLLLRLPAHHWRRNNRCSTSLHACRVRRHPRPEGRRGRHAGGRVSSCRLGRAASRTDSRDRLRQCWRPAHLRSVDKRVWRMRSRHRVARHPRRRRHRLLHSATRLLDNGSLPLLGDGPQAPPCAALAQLCPHPALEVYVAPWGPPSRQKRDS